MRIKLFTMLMILTVVIIPFNASAQVFSFDTYGVYEWESTSTFQATVECWGGGGGGGGGITQGRGGGEGGHYTKSTINFTQGHKYQIYVGNGGFGEGSPGSQSYLWEFSKPAPYILCKGGMAGQERIGGSGGTEGMGIGNIGDEIHIGGKGGDSLGGGKSGGGGGGSAGNAGCNGYDGSNNGGETGGTGGNGCNSSGGNGGNYNSNGSSGNSPGAGGGGAGGGKNTTSAAGKDGRILITPINTTNPPN